MAAPGGADGRGNDTAAGVNAIEGYLLWQAETARGQERARGFAAGLTWLTTAQREEVERAYLRDHLEHAEAALRATAERVTQLRAEYRAAYNALSRRLVATFLLVLGVAVALALWLMSV